MTFFSIILRGLWRRPVRTGLTLLGVAIGVGAVVALVGISRGFESSWEGSLQSRGTDIVVSNLGSALTPKPFDQALRDRIVDLPHIDTTCGILVEVMSIEGSPMMMISAREWGGFTWDSLKILSGRLPADQNEESLVLGKTAAELLDKELGDTVKIGTRDLEVVGIVDGGGSMENGSAILSLDLLQDITGNEDRINIIDIRLEPGTSENEARVLCDQITEQIPDARAMVAGEHVRSSQGYKIIRAMSWGTSLLAVLVGVLGVMNTMLMTVFERTQEICVLLAIGWKKRRIMAMILWESALIGLFGGILGVALGIVGVKLLEQAPAVHGLLESDLSPELIGQSVLIAIGVGIISGLYPAWRGSRLTPSQAIQG